MTGRLAPPSPPDFLAEIRFLTTEQGGRRTPALSGYPPSHDFGIPEGLNDARHYYIDRDSVAPGETALAYLWLLSPEQQNGRLFPEFTFTVQEGSRIVGYGTVLEVVNNTLLKQV